MKTVAETKQTALGWSGSFNESDVVCVVSAFRLLLLLFLNLFFFSFSFNMKELRDIDYELLYVSVLILGGRTSSNKCAV